MNFERGKDIKEILQIGLKGNPIKIGGVYHPDLNKLTDLDEDAEASLIIMTSKLDDKSAFKILESIERGYIRDGWDKRYYINHWGEWSPQKTYIQAEINFEPLEKFRGKYLQLNGRKYLIPLCNSKEEKT